VDPSGHRIVVVSGVFLPPSMGSALAKKIQERVSSRISKYDSAGQAEILVKLLGWGDQASEDKMVRQYQSFQSGKEHDTCSLEQFIVVGHSDGATAIYRSLLNGAIGKGATGGSAGGEGREFTPAFIGMVDLVRLEYDFASANKDKDGGQVWVPKPKGTTMYAFYETKGTWFPFVGVGYGRPIVGVDKLFRHDDVNHFGIWKHDGVHETIAEAAAEAYERRIRSDGRPRPWRRGEGMQRGRRW